MKKYLSIIAIALASVFTFTSCDKEDKPAVETPDKEPAPLANYVRFSGLFSENIFEYGTISIVVECGKESKTFEVNEKCKTTGDYFVGLVDGVNINAYRKIDIPAFIYNDGIATFTAKFKLSEEGKKKIAEAGDKDIAVGYATELSCAHSSDPIQLDKHMDIQKNGALVPIKYIQEHFDEQIEIGNTLIRKTQEPEKK